GEKAGEAIALEPGNEDGFRSAQRADSLDVQNKIASVSPHFAQILNAVSDFKPTLQIDKESLSVGAAESDFATRLSLLRRRWTRSVLGIVVSEIDGQQTISETKNQLTALAEESINAALFVTRHEISRRYK